MEIKELGTNFDEQYRNDLNNNFKELSGMDLVATDALNKATSASQQATSAEQMAQQAKTTSENANVTSNSVQEQLNQIVIEGSIDPETKQARVDAKGVAYENVKERIDAEQNKIEVNADKISSVLEKNFERFLDYQKILYSVDTLLTGISDFPQGFSINQEANELYIARQINGGTDVKISRYSLPSCTLLDTKSFTKSSSAYQEGLPFFYDTNQKLCFLVRVDYSDNLAIFNYTDGVLGVNIAVPGGSKVGCDKDKKYLITSYGTSDRTERIFIYDFKSILDETPVLIKTIYLPNAIVDGEKIQGLTIIDDKIILGQGKTYPVMTVMDFNGTILNTTELNKKDLGTLAKNFDNQTIDVNNFIYENEGVAFYQYNNKLLPIICHIIGNKVYFTLCGSLEFEKINTALNTGKSVSNSIKWVDATLEPTVTNYAADVSVRYSKDGNGIVYIEGVCTHPYTSQNPNLVLLKLPFPYAPKRNKFYNTQASGGADKRNRIEIKKNGDVILVTTTSTSTTPFTAFDGIIFNAE